MKHHRHAVYAFVVFAMLFANPTASRAQDCNALVVDGAGIFGAQFRAVEDAARELRDAGADVYVRTFRTLGGFSDLRSLEADLKSRCSNWNRETYINVLMALQERKVAILFDPSWNSTLGGADERIQKQVMGPQFRSGNFANGFVLALDQLETLVTRHLSAASAAPPVERTPAPQAPTVVVQQPSQPTDLSGLWSVLKWIIGLVVLVLVVVFGIAVYREAEKRRLAQRKAKSAKTDCSNLVNNLPTELALLQARCTSTSKQMEQQEAEKYAKQYGKAARLFDEASIEFAGTNRNVGGRLETAGLSGEEYGEIENQYRGVLRKLASAATIVQECDRELDQFEQRIAGLDTALETAATDIDNNRTTVEKVKAAGYFVVTQLAKLTEADSSLTSAKDLKNRGHLGPAMTAAETASALAKGAGNDALGLAQQKSELELRVAACEQRIEEVKQNVISGAQSFARMNSLYAAAALEPIKGNGSKATAIVTACMDHVREAKRRISMDVQDWAGADQIIDRMQDDKKQQNDPDGLLAQAESLMHSLFELEKSLEQARKDAPRTIASTRSDIERADRHIAEYEKAVDLSHEVEANMKEAKRLLRKAETEMEESKPDYLEVVKFARRAHDLVDEVLKNARSEHEQFLRLKEKAADKLKSARARVSKAKEYYEDHRGDIKRKAKQHLTDAQARLREAEDAARSANDQTTFNTIIVLADQADDLGKKSYREANDDVEAANPVVVSTYGGSTGYETSYTAPSRPQQSSGVSYDWGGSDTRRDSGGTSFDFGSAVSSVVSSVGSETSW